MDGQMQILLQMKETRKEGNLGANDLGFSVDGGECGKATGESSS